MFSSSARSCSSGPSGLIRGRGVFRAWARTKARRAGQGPAGEVGEGRPVAVGQAGDLERVAGDHLQVEADLRPGRAQDVRTIAGQVEEPVAERDLGEQEPVARIPRRPCP